jgi:hypothetical protein
MLRHILAAVSLSLLAALPASASEFRPVESRSGFVDLVSGKSLTRFGVELAVTPGGDIRGRAFGRPVTGAWRWDGRYFCRDLYFGSQDLGPNCQVVQVSGDKLRFIADRGAGDHADLRLE